MKPGLSPEHMVGNAAWLSLRKGAQYFLTKSEACRFGFNLSSSRSWILQSSCEWAEKRPVSVNARIVAATNRDLKREVENGNFREDLFHRLNVFAIHVPPLRERREDLPLLVQEILESLARRIGLSHVPTLELEAMQALAARGWPGNVRELRNFLERGLILSDKDRITAPDLGLPKSHPVQMDGNDISVFIRLSDAGSFHEAINEAKRRLLAENLRQSGGSIKEAAELLKVSRDSFVHHMRTLGVRK